MYLPIYTYVSTNQCIYLSIYISQRQYIHLSLYIEPLLPIFLTLFPCQDNGVQETPTNQLTGRQTHKAVVQCVLAILQGDKQRLSQYQHIVVDVIFVTIKPKYSLYELSHFGRLLGGVVVLIIGPVLDCRR